MEQIKTIYLYLLSPELIPQPYFMVINILKAVFLLISILLITGILVAISKSNWIRVRTEDMKEFSKFKPSILTKMAKEWKKINTRLQSGEEAEYKLAVIEADDMTNSALTRLEYPGKTLGEKLKELNQEIIPNIEDLKMVHQVRGDIVHDPNYRLDIQKTREILKVYQQFFIDFKVL